VTSGARSGAVVSTEELSVCEPWRATFSPRIGAEVWQVAKWAGIRRPSGDYPLDEDVIRRLGKQCSFNRKEEVGNHG
jgi:hypothetical protein